MKSFKIWNLLYLVAAIAISLSLIFSTSQSNSAQVAGFSSYDHSQMAMDDMAMPGMDISGMAEGQAGLNSNSFTSQAVAGSGPTVEVSTVGGLLVFVPAVITITAKQTVTWVWVHGTH